MDLWANIYSKYANAISIDGSLTGVEGDDDDDVDKPYSISVVPDSFTSMSCLKLISMIIASLIQLTIPEVSESTTPVYWLNHLFIKDFGVWGTMRSW